MLSHEAELQDRENKMGRLGQRRPPGVVLT
jgi:hypothetical protein